MLLVAIPNQPALVPAGEQMKAFWPRLPSFTYEDFRRHREGDVKRPDVYRVVVFRSFIRQVCVPVLLTKNHYVVTKDDCQDAACRVLLTENHYVV